MGIVFAPLLEFALACRLGICVRSPVGVGKGRAGAEREAVEMTWLREHVRYWPPFPGSGACADVLTGHLPVPVVAEKGRGRIGKGND